MRVYDTITQTELNEIIDDLLLFYHKELDLGVEDASNDYCDLSFDLSEGVDAGNEIIFNKNDKLTVNVSNKRLAELGYSLKFSYYELNKGDYLDNKSYDELKTITLDLDNTENTLTFDADQIYLQKDFKLVLMNTGTSLTLTASNTSILVTDSVTLTANYIVDTLPIENRDIEFYEGNTLIDTVTTDNRGNASLQLSNLTVGTHSFNVSCDGVYSTEVQVIVVNDTYCIELEVTDSRFGTYSISPFTYTGRVFVDWGDDTGLIEYAGGQLYHSYSVSDTYTVRIYGRITSLERGCFYNCNSLTSVIISESVTSLGERCFHNCTGLTSINIPSSVTILGGGCFYNCTGLTSITIPSSVTSLGMNCFGRCTDLTSINIPSSVTSLGERCFHNCTGLTSIQLNWNTTTEIVTYDSSWIYLASANVKFSIPNGTTLLYTAKGYPSDKLVERLE